MAKRTKAKRTKAKRTKVKRTKVKRTKVKPTKVKKSRKPRATAAAKAPAKAPAKAKHPFSASQLDKPSGGAGPGCYFGNTLDESIHDQTTCESAGGEWKIIPGGTQTQTPPPPAPTTGGAMAPAKAKQPLPASGRGPVRPAPATPGCYFGTRLDESIHDQMTCEDKGGEWKIIPGGSQTQTTPPPGG